MLELGARHEPISRLLAEQLAEVETRFGAELVSDLSCVNDLARHVERYRGKMLRPMLVLLSGLAARPDHPLGEDHQVVAAVVEMVHMATLVHDDVLDESSVRRQGETINHLRGNESAVMLGDYLISHAYNLCSSIDSPVPARTVAQTTNTLCEGELLQLSNRNNWTLDEQTYFEIIRRKTAALCGTSCRLGALLSGADATEAEALNRYGEQVGIAFQIIDDVLDLTGDQSVVGKSLGKDLEKGKLTLPLIHRLETAPPAEHQQLLALLRAEDEGRFEKIGCLLSGSDSVAHARRRAAQFIDRAKQTLENLDDSPARSMLMDMADAVVTREA
ncbi:MAG: polyprenyl synthetase family protein [Phycisphaeraceae bacterium]|nr:polyprenyl synthetase family protein [Phycisphaeraceae bacterium]